MKFFLDTANLDDIRRWQRLGLVDGVTTNPSLLAKEGASALDHLKRVLELVEGPVSAQVTHAEPEQMIEQGRALAALGKNLVVKVPATEAGYHAAAALTGEGHRCNITLAFQAAQAIPFARIPVAYVSLIYGRTEDFGLSTTAEITRIRDIFDSLGTQTELLVASIRNPGQLVNAVTGGADIVTVPPATWAVVHANPLSSQGRQDFDKTWRSLPEEMRQPYERIGSGILQEA